MEKTAFNRGFTANSNVTHQRERRSPLWRPWTGTNGAVTRTAQSVRHGTPDPTMVKPCLQVVHPVKLYWPKSKCFDYLYQDAEQLLRNYPVQATICPCEDSSSDEESDYGEEDPDEEEEEAEQKELN